MYSAPRCIEQHGLRALSIRYIECGWHWSWQQECSLVSEVQVMWASKGRGCSPGRTERHSWSINIAIATNVDVGGEDFQFYEEGKCDIMFHFYCLTLEQYKQTLFRCVLFTKRMHQLQKWDSARRVPGGHYRVHLSRRLQGEAASALWQEWPDLSFG